MDPKLIFPPVVEANLPGAIITEHPRDVMSGSSVKRQFLTGITYNEGLIKAVRKNMSHLYRNLVLTDYGKSPLLRIAISILTHSNVLILNFKLTSKFLVYLTNLLRIGLMPHRSYFIITIAISPFKIRLHTKSPNFTFKTTSLEIKKKILQM